MKKFLLLCIFSAACFFPRAQTNTYHPFPDSNATWNIHYSFAFACPFYVDLNAYYSYTITGDTIINSQNYHVISIPYVDANCPAIPVPGIVACIRQDTALRKVFYIWHSDIVEKVLYDFNMSLGDTMHNLFMQSCIVTSIDSILIGNDYRKQWHVGGLTNTVSIIEGIGSANGIFEDCNCYTVDGPGAQLMCFTNNGTTLYPGAATQCDLITPVGDPGLNTAETTLSISPNPFHSEAKLEYGEWGPDSYRDGQLKIYNSKGILIREEKISNLNSYTLHREALHDGLYFYELRTLDQELIGTGKFVIQ